MTTSSNGSPARGRIAASFGGDLVLVPADQVDEAFELLRRAGHRVIG